MIHFFTYNTTITNLIIGDRYRFEASVDVSSSRIATVDPALTEFISSDNIQRISLFLTKDTEDIIVLKTKTTNLTKNITNVDQIIIKCSELDLCRVPPTPSITQSSGLTPTPTNTSSSTSTPTPTNTATPTQTAAPTYTQTPTPTLTPTNTATTTKTPAPTPTTTPTTTTTPTPTPTATTCNIIYTDCVSSCEAYAIDPSIGTWKPENCATIAGLAVDTIDDGKWSRAVAINLASNNPNNYTLNLINKDSMTGADMYWFVSNVTLNIPKTILIDGISFIYDNNSKWLSSSGDELSIISNNVYNYFELKKPLRPNAIYPERYAFAPRVRYRELYRDFTLVENTTYTFARRWWKAPNYGYVVDEFEAAELNNWRWDINNGSNITLFNYYDQNYNRPGLQYWNTISINFNTTNSCRQPEPCPAIAACRNEIDLLSLDMTNIPCDKCRPGGGRPIDIDIHCNGKIRPLSSDFPSNISSFTLWFAPRGLQSVPVVNNILYDTTNLDKNLDIVKVHTTATVADMREWVCKNLRFVTIKDYSKLKTDINSAVDSNWPYNDLYWNSLCTGYDTIHPNDVPINLVPC